MLTLKSQTALPLSIATLDGARGGGAPAALADAAHAGGVPVLSRVTRWFSRRRSDKLVVASYEYLFEADDHILADVGVTRLDVARLIQASTQR